MKTKIFFSFLIVSCFLSVVFFVAVLPAQAWNWGEPLVPCGTSVNPTACTRCELFHLLKNLIDFGLIAVLPVGATLLFVIAGIFYILGGANPSMHARAKGIFTNTLYGIVIIALSWVITNTILTAFSDGGTWGQFVCVNPVANPLPTISNTPGGPTPTPTPVTGVCSDPQSLAQQYKARYPADNSQALDAMISCVLANPAVAALIDRSQVFTIERDNPLCNYTRGLSVCGKCAHSPNSCHYGGRAGTNGAESVDFNAIGGKEYDLWKALEAIKAQCRIKWVNYEVTHTHLTTWSCDSY